MIMIPIAAGIGIFFMHRSGMLSGSMPIVVIGLLVLIFIVFLLTAPTGKPVGF